MAEVSRDITDGRRVGRRDRGDKRPSSTSTSKSRYLRGSLSIALAVVLSYERSIGPMVPIAGILTFGYGRPDPEFFFEEETA
jgi:hypothetical protein